MMKSSQWLTLPSSSVHNGSQGWKNGEDAAPPCTAAVKGSPPRPP
jgi:hypothetical protein